MTLYIFQDGGQQPYWIWSR